jgi:hypothetical protein
MRRNNEWLVPEVLKYMNGGRFNMQTKTKLYGLNQRANYTNRENQAYQLS